VNHSYAAESQENYHPKVYVYDSSFVGALIIPDERSPQIQKLRSFITEEDEIFVPYLLWYEIGNVFKNLVLRKRYTYDEILSFVPSLEALRLVSDIASGADYTEKLLRLANDYALSSYDAAYMELAGRKKAALCTMDNKLQKAAEKYGVVVLK
jgi:predicted nucleic acid-binding protein